MPPPAASLSRIPRSRESAKPEFFPAIPSPAPMTRAHSNRVAFALLFLAISISSSPAASASQGSCAVPLDETKSAPAIDLLLDGVPVDRDRLIDKIASGLDSSLLEPQLSRIYRREPLPIAEGPALSYPAESALVEFESPLASTAGLVRARVSLPGEPNRAFQMNLSLDTHAALARNALLRRLGYAVTPPRHYFLLKVRFPSPEVRDSFLDQLSNDTLTARSRWVIEDLSSPARDLLTLTFRDLVLEPALIEIPQLHWGIFPSSLLASRRPLRALLVPLTVLELPESVNLFSPEPAKIFNDSLVFTRPRAEVFQAETSIGDVRWIARKLAKLSRSEWSEILRAARYPPDIEALLLEKTLSRVNRLIRVASISDFTPHAVNLNLSTGAVIRGKATREQYEGYALRFTYGDPESPLRASELARFFGISAIGGVLSSILELGSSYLQAVTPSWWVQKHQERAWRDLLNHVQTRPNEPYSQPVQIWGGPVAGANLSAARTILTGTYYGSTSGIQLVDSLTASANFGGFFGISGIPGAGLALSPTVQGSRTFVRVRPMPDVKTAWKESWSRVAVPAYFQALLKRLDGPDATAAASALFESLAPGELLIVSDSVISGARASVQIPLGALIGFLPSFGSVDGSASLSGNFTVLSRTTIARTDEGLQIYLQNAHSGTLDLDLSARIILRAVDLNTTAYRGRARTEAYLIPEALPDGATAESLRRALRALLLKQNPEVLREEFAPWKLDHRVKGHRLRLGIGPFSWLKRETIHRVTIVPPADPEGRYRAEEFRRTVLEATRTRVHGSDWYGFAGATVRDFAPFLNLAGPARGDDPSANFGGRSTSTVVNAQVELTPGRESDVFLRVDHAFSGWHLSKKRFLGLWDALLRPLEGLRLAPGELVNRDEFHQTRAVQAFRLGYTLLIDSEGARRILALVDSRTTGTIEAFRRLVAFMGKSQYEAFCKQSGYEPRIYQGTRIPDGFSVPVGSVLEQVDKTAVLLGCATEFMKSVFRLRAEIAREREQDQEQEQDEEQAKDRLRRLIHVTDRLLSASDVAMMIRIAGESHSFFQASLSGFRTHDENGDSQYFSNTIGLIEQEPVGGPLSDIAAGSGISSNEIEARYLSNGY